ncbi:MAG: 2-oxoacid:ferredoxin oxidoreductase subunit beta [Crocinitomicaceae bacterium]|nr:2-oxoacid:ferredoxin oxidoreductase subunit beta [Crocinitomicaceae bacterium]
MTKQVDEQIKYKARDFASDQEIRWCPGCGDYAILKQVQAAVAEIGVKKEDIAFISGIGCSSRFPYYMETYGMHSIHGRATAISSGLKAARPELSVWIITGDGDSLSIGGNHLIHLLRRNFDTNILLFNNEIYGLTKGQYSPTSPEGKVSKSSPLGSIDHPFNPAALALGADATFVARTIDREPRHMKNIFLEAEQHKGASFVEIYQNCIVFNDGAFSPYTERGLKEEHLLFLEEGKPLLFNKDTKGVKLDGFTPVVVDMENASADDLMIHDPSDPMKAHILSRIFDDPQKEHVLPRPFGVFYKADRATYEDALQDQIEHAIERSGKGDLDALLRGNNTWVVE